MILASVTDEKAWIEFENNLKQHDWYFEYSDDGRVWRAGKEAQGRIRHQRNSLVQVDPERANQLYEKYAKG
jgi:hypothetical protein